jgi:hypothetical protein
VVVVLVLRFGYATRLFDYEHSGRPLREDP